MSQPAKKASIWSVGFITLIVVNLFQYIAQMMMQAIVPLYAYDLGATASIVGVISGAFGITALASRPFVGPAFDAFSKKWLFFTAMCLYTLATFLYSLATTVPVLFAVRLVHGLAMGISGPLGLALAVQMLPPERMSSGVGVYTLAQVLGQAAGPAFGIWLSEAYGYRITFLLCCVCMATSMILMFFMKEPPGPTRTPYKLSLDRMFAKAAIPLATIVFLLNLAYICVTSFIVIYAGLKGIEAIGLYFTVYALSLLVTRPVMGNLADRFSTKVVLIPSIAFYAASFIILAVAPSLVPILISGVFAALGYGASIPLLQAQAMKIVSLEERGRCSNTMYTGLDLSLLLGPTFGGFVVDLALMTTAGEAAAYSLMWLTMLAPIAFALVMYLIWERSHKDPRHV